MNVDITTKGLNREICKNAFPLKAGADPLEVSSMRLNVEKSLVFRRIHLAVEEKKEDHKAEERSSNPFGIF